MNTEEPKLKKFVEKWNKRNADIEARKENDRAIIKFEKEESKQNVK